MKQVEKNDMAAASGASLQALVTPNCADHNDIKSQENLLFHNEVVREESKY